MMCVAMKACPGREDGGGRSSWYGSTFLMGWDGMVRVD